MIPVLVVNKTSDEVFVTADTNDQLVVLLRTHIHWKLLLQPDHLVFTTTTKRQSFTITPRLPGVYTIWYRLGVPWEHLYYPLATVRSVSP